MCYSHVTDVHVHATCINHVSGVYCTYIRPQSCEFICLNQSVTMIHTMYIHLFGELILLPLACFDVTGYVVEHSKGTYNHEMFQPRGFSSVTKQKCKEISNI